MSANVSVRKFAISAAVAAGLFSSLIPSDASASSVSLLNEVDWIECRPSGDNAGFTRLEIDPKDNFADLYDGKKLIKRFDRTKFLDSAMLLEAKDSGNSREHALFQILPSGDTIWLTGKLRSLFEKDCDDTGASKTCKTESLSRLFWSSEKIEIEFEKTKFSGPMTTYGFFANKGTYFRFSKPGARNQSSNAAVLLDYGAPLDLLVGHESKLTCKHVKRAKSSP